MVVITMGNFAADFVKLLCVPRIAINYGPVFGIPVAVVALIIDESLQDIQRPRFVIRISKQDQAKIVVPTWTKLIEVNEFRLRSLSGYHKGSLGLLERATPSHGFELWA